MKKIKEIAEFSKLFKINIPKHDEFEYYISTLSKSLGFRFINALVEQFAEYEKYVKDEGYENTAQYKMKYAFPKLKEYIEGTKAYEEVQNFDLPKEQLRTKNLIKENTNSVLISFDFKEANFNTIKKFEKKFESELNGTWAQLCNHLNIHYVLALSKSFRQLVFGNLNPKRFQRIQHINILKLIDEHLLKSSAKEEDIISINHDEVIVRLSEDKEKRMWHAASKAASLCPPIEIDSVFHLRHNEINGFPIRHTIFTLDKLAKNIYLKTIYNLKEENHGACCFTGPRVSHYLDESYKTLWGCPGNQFYMYFKRYVLEEGLDSRDAFFYNDNMLAKWDVETFLEKHRIK